MLFNDPFDCRPVLFDDLPDSHWQKIAESIWKKDGHPATDRELIDSLFYTQRFRELMPTVLESLKKLMVDRIGILSLSECSDSVVLWAYYSAGHTGYAIGFRTDHEFFGHTSKPLYTSGRVCRVTYAKDRPKRNVQTLRNVDQFFTKSDEWAHEREWRMFLNLDDAAKVTQAEPLPIYLFALPPSCIADVIIGANASKATVDAILRAIEETQALAHVRLLRVVVDPDVYRLMLVPHCKK